jgi:hypothetical protein
MKRTTLTPKLICTALLAVGLLTASAARSAMATRDWQGDDTKFWGNDRNWYGGDMPTGSMQANFGSRFGSGGDQPTVGSGYFYLNQIKVGSGNDKAVTITLNGQLRINADSDASGVGIMMSAADEKLTFDGEGTLKINSSGSGDTSEWRVTGTGDLEVRMETLELAGASLNVNVGSGRSVKISSAIEGSSAIVKNGTGNMSFIDEGTARANTNTGLFTINSGIVYLNQSSTNTTIVSNIDITDGELSLTQNDQIKDTSAITLTGGTFHTNGKTETVGSILLNASDAKLDGTGGSLTVTGGVDARSGTINTDLVGGTTLAKTTGGTVTVNAGGLVSGDILVEAGLLDYDSTTGITSNVSISGGEMDLATSLGSGGAISVTGGLLSYNGGTELTSISFTSGSIGGSGDVNLGGVTLGSSQTLAPGNSIGSQTISGISELDGATYELEFGLGLAQNNDKLTIEGDVALTALTIDLYTMLDTDTRGNMDGFDQSQNYVWEDVLTITGTVTGTVDNITLDTTNVTDSYSGEFSIVDAGGGAYDLEYNIPEPATMSLLALGGIAMLKRRKK